MVRDEQPAEYSMRIAIAMIGDTQLELIEPLDDRNIYAEFLRTHGEGLHHVGLGTRDYGEALEQLRDMGHRVIQGGLYNGVTFAYLSTERELGFIAEVFDWPEEREQKPDAVYPPADGSAAP
jgi:hypothetical protein